MRRIRSGRQVLHMWPAPVDALHGPCVQNFGQRRVGWAWGWGRVVKIGKPYFPPASYLPAVALSHHFAVACRAPCSTRFSTHSHALFSFLSLAALPRHQGLRCQTLLVLGWGFKQPFRGSVLKTSAMTRRLRFKNVVGFLRCGRPSTASAVTTWLSLLATIH